MNHEPFCDDDPRRVDDELNDDDGVTRSVGAGAGPSNFNSVEPPAFRCVFDDRIEW